jgi:hypothetical protein
MHLLKMYFYFTLLGHVTAQLVEALYYKLEGHGFDSRWCHLTQSFWQNYGTG